MNEKYHEMILGKFTSMEQIMSNQTQQWKGN